MIYFNFNYFQKTVDRNIPLIIAENPEFSELNLPSTVSHHDVSITTRKKIVVKEPASEKKKIDENLNEVMNINFGKDAVNNLSIAFLTIRFHQHLKLEKWIRKVEFNRKEMLRETRQICHKRIFRYHRYNLRSSFY